MKHPTIYSVMSLYESGTNKILNGSYWCLNVGTVEKSKTMEKEGI